VAKGDIRRRQDGIGLLPCPAKSFDVAELHVSAPTNTRQNTNGQAATTDAKLKDEGHGEGRVDVKPIAPEVSSQG
jgi:hypothetical protein